MRISASTFSCVPVLQKKSRISRLKRMYENSKFERKINCNIFVCLESLDIRKFERIINFNCNIIIMYMFTRWVRQEKLQGMSAK